MSSEAYDIVDWNSGDLSRSESDTHSLTAERYIPAGIPINLRRSYFSSISDVVAVPDHSRTVIRVLAVFPKAPSHWVHSFKLCRPHEDEVPLTRYTAELIFDFYDAPSERWIVNRQIPIDAGYIGNSPTYKMNNDIFTLADETTLDQCAQLYDIHVQTAANYHIDGSHMPTILQLCVPPLWSKAVPPASSFLPQPVFLLCEAQYVIYLINNLLPASGQIDVKLFDSAEKVYRKLADLEVEARLEESLDDDEITR